MTTPPGAAPESDAGPKSDAEPGSDAAPVSEAAPAPDAAPVTATGGVAPVDLRLVPVAAVAWAGSLLGLVAGPGRAAGLAALLAGAAVVLLLRSRPAAPVAAGAAGGEPVAADPATAGGGWAGPGHAGRRVTVAALLLVTAAAVLTGAVAEQRRATGPVAALAAGGRTATVTARVERIPRPLVGGAPGSVLVRLRVTAATVPPAAAPVATDALVTGLADRSWAGVEPGTTVTAQVRLRQRRRFGPDAASASVRGPPSVVHGAEGLRSVTSGVRAGLVRVAAPLGQPAAGLLPAVVTGDTSRVPAEVAERFRVSGLSHLEAVSGANVAVVVALVTGLTVAVGGGRVASAVTGTAAVAGFAVLADLSPSVVRAGATAVLVLAGARRARSRGPALLAAAVVVLLGVDPWLTVDVGFALSVAATAGILVGAGRFTEALGEWLPRRVAAGAAMALTAQLACQPLLTALSAQVGLVALFTNLAAEPAVGVATVSGLGAAVAAAAPVPHLLAGPVGAVADGLAAVGGAACRWLAFVAGTGAAAPGATADAPGGAAGIAVSCLLSAAALALGPLLVRRRRVALVLAGVLAGLVVGPLVV